MVRTVIRFSLFLLLCAAGPVAAKSYDHPLVHQTVRLQPDGTLEMVDLRSYAFDGEYHNAFLTVDPHRRGDVRFEGVDAQDGGSLRNVRTEGNTLRWSYDARNETRTFRIAYALTGEVDRSPDAAIFDRQLVEPDHAPIRQYHLEIILPKPATLFKVFVITTRGIVGEMDVNNEEGRATIDMTSVDGFVRVRALFDPDQVPGVSMVDTPMYETWLAETAKATESYRSRTRARLLKRTKPLPTAVAPFMALVAGLFSFWSFRKYRSMGVEPAVGDIGPYFREPAEEIPPAVVPYITSQFNPGVSVAPFALGATLLDFARRGYLRLKERDKASFLGFGGGTEVDFQIAAEPPAGAIADFERDVWLMLVAASGKDDMVTPKELKKFFEKNTTWIQSWSGAPRDWYERTHGPLLAGGHAGWMALMILGGMLTMAGMIFVGVFSRNPAVLATGIVSGVVAGLFGLICGVALPRWRPEALLRARKWKAYGKFLEDFSAMEEAPAEHYKMWDYHFIYATSLGVAKKYLANLKKLMAVHPERFSTPAWIMMSHSNTGALDAARGLGFAQANLESLTANLSALESALSQTTSSGGGFSGGGSGGSSGGGGSSGAS